MIKTKRVGEVLNLGEFQRSQDDPVNSDGDGSLTQETVSTVRGSEKIQT